MNRKYFSGLRRMEGEDLDYGDRLYKQKLQQRLWLEEQKRQEEARAEADRQEKERRARYDATMQQLWDQADTDAKERQYAMEKAVLDTNLQQETEKLNREAALRQQETEAKLQHMAYTTNHPFFTEDPATTQSQLAPHRVLPYHYKGMNDQQLKEIFDEQKRQVEEKAARKQRERDQELADARQSEAQRRAALVFERQVGGTALRTRQENRDYLKTQMIEHRVRETDPYNERGPDYLIPK